MKSATPKEFIDFINAEFDRDMYRCYRFRGNIYEALSMQAEMMKKWGIELCKKQSISIVEPFSSLWQFKDWNSCCQSPNHFIVPITASINRMDLTAFYGADVEVDADRTTDFAREFLRELVAVKPKSIYFLAKDTLAQTSWNIAKDGAWSEMITDLEVRALLAYSAMKEAGEIGAEAMRKAALNAIKEVA